MTIYFSVFKLYKSYILLVSDQKDMGIGTITLGSPSTIKGLNPPTVSYNLFGVDIKIINKILAEKASLVLNAPVLLILFLKTKEKEENFVKPLVKFLSEILDEIAEKK